MPKRAKNNAQDVATRPTREESVDYDIEPEYAQPKTTANEANGRETSEPTIADIFGPGGAIEKCMPDGYEHRPSQLEMAELVEAAFRDKRHLIVEAGTGTGKTLAYLVPAIRSGRRVVISTA